MGNEEPILVDEKIPPDEFVLKDVLKTSYTLYDELINEITSKNYNLIVEWKYYKDGKSWLCKVTNKKRTIFWLSVWSGYFKVTFYFTEKFNQEIMHSGIDENHIKQYLENKSIGKLKPLTIIIDNYDALADVKKLITIRG